MSTYSFAWKGSKLLKVSNLELSQQENRGGCLLTFQFFFYKAFERYLLLSLIGLLNSSEGTRSSLQLSEQLNKA